MTIASDSGSSFDMLKKEVETVLGIQFFTIYQNAQPYKEMFPTIDQDVDANLLKGIQDILKMKASVYGSPLDHLHLKEVRTLFVEPVLCNALFYAKKKNDLHVATLRALLEPGTPIEKLQNTGKDKADYAIIFDDDEVRVGGGKSDRKSVVIVEVKRSNARAGVPQCFLAMKSTYNARLKEMVYGVTTDGAQWILCSYNGGTAFQISKPIPVMEGISSDDWASGEGADLVKILHMIFDRQIQRVLTQPNEDEEEKMETAQSEPVVNQQAGENHRKAMEEATSAWIKNLVPGDLDVLEDQVKTLIENLQQLINLAKGNK